MQRRRGAQFKIRDLGRELATILHSRFANIIVVQLPVLHLCAMSPELKRAESVDDEDEMKIGIRMIGRMRARGRLGLVKKNMDGSTYP